MKHLKSGGKFSFCLAIVFGLAPSGWAQESFQWPEKPKNLKVLPADWPGKRLRPVMTGFTRALGVGCSYCHVGQVGSPLNTYDFASDENPRKETARAMLKLLGVVNDQLKEIKPSGPKRVNMWCHTCHRGRPRPMTLREELTEKFESEGIQATIEHYRVLRKKFYGRGAYNFGEFSLNGLGYQILGQLPEAAIEIFRLNVEYFPNSSNVYDSLGEAYMMAGKKDLAIQNYEKSLELNPNNNNAVEKLKELREPK